MKRYGFFGGSFNPPTIAHERLAEEIAEKFKLDKVYFVPVGNYYKKTDLIDENKRLAMLESIRNDKIDVLDIELNSKKKLLAVDAFELINDNFSSSENYFILGGDNLEKLPNWENATKCLNNNIIAIQRGKNLANIIVENKLLEENKNKIFKFNANKLYNYSSTEVRKAIKNDDIEILNKMLNKKVYFYIKENNLYKGIK
ncbi:MAG: nicotinate (nicotinamide) nucleotide adenylyltransferase [Clostridium sp.]|nr:nicotinate (nicotinamide) nucleotide adenylyltransferase [Clostridium sp.]